ncbi:MAG: hypothetical protein Fur0016_20330 [Anaerolineales bacterium]
MMTDSTLEQKTPAEINEIFIYNDRFLAAAYLSMAVGVIILIINLLRIGGSRFVLGLNSVVALATVVTLLVLSLRIYDRLKNVPRTNLLWMSISIGFGLWTFLEAVRLIVFLASSAPRFFVLNWLWVIGYFSLFYGLYLRYIDLETPLTVRQKQIVWGGVGLGLAYLLFAQFLPLLGGKSPSVSGAIAGLLYALADLGLLFLLGSISLSLWGKFGGPWKYFALAVGMKFLGEAVMQFPSNLGTGFLFSFANFFHYAWYGFAAFGLLVYDMALSHPFGPATKVVAKEEMTPNASALIFTDEQDNVIKTSINFRYVMRLPDSIVINGAPLHKVLGVSEESFQEFKAQLRKHGNLKKYVIQPSYLRAGYKAWLTAIASSDQQRRYSGMDMVVQVLTESLAGAGLTNEERALVENIFYLSGASGTDNQNLLITYFNLHYKMLAGLAFQYEGSRRAAGLSDRVNQVAKQQRLMVRVLEQELNVPENVKLDDLGKSVSILLAAGREYMSGQAGKDVVIRETERLHREADRSTKILIKKYDLARMN